LFGIALPAAAVDDGTLGIRPQYESDFFHLSIAPGAEIDVNAIITNRGDSPLTLLTYLADGVSTPQGAFALAPQGEPSTELGLWGSVGSSDVTVAARSELLLPMKVQIPWGTLPGDYIGGLIIQQAPVEGETTETADGSATVRMDVIQRQGVRIYLTVTGTAVTSLTQGELQWQKNGDSLDLILPIENTGNTTLNPSTTVEFTSWIGANTWLPFKDPGSIIPDETREVQASLTPAPFIQIGRATAVTVSEAGTNTSSVFIFSVPWPVLVALALLLAGLSYGIVALTRFVRRARRAFAELAGRPPVFAS
jgi:hypothetical protein